MEPRGGSIKTRETEQRDTGDRGEWPRASQGEDHEFHKQKPLSNNNKKERTQKLPVR